jgi:hypothetical protein
VFVGDRVIGSAMVEEPCDLRIDRRDLKEHRETLNEADAVLVMSCGAGVQTVGKLTYKLILPTLNIFLIG